MSPTATISAPARLQPSGPAPIVRLPRRPDRLAGSHFAALGLAVALAASPLASGYFNIAGWGPLALGAIVVVIALAIGARTTLPLPAGVTAAGLGLLLALSAASMLWAESRDSAWSAANRLGLYCVIFAIVLLAVRERRVGRAVLLILGSAALVSTVVLSGEFLLGTGTGAFVLRRLSAPIGYVNGTAGLLAMGIWPWLALSETASRRSVRAAALSAAALIAGTFVLTQSRAVIPATLLSAVLVLACAPERLRRAVNLAVVGAALAATLPWTLAVYSSGPSPGTLRAAAGAILVAALGAGGVRFALATIGNRIGAVTIRRLGVAAIAVTVVGIAAGAAAGAPWLARQYRAFTALRVHPNASVRFVDAGGYRYDLWRAAITEFRRHPLAGVGAGNYDAEYYRLRRNPEYVLEPHSLELQIAAELGVAGLGALLLFCGGVLFAAFKQRGTLASEDRLIKVAAAGVFVSWLVATSVDWLYDIPGLAGMAIAAAALLVAPSNTRIARRPGRPIARVVAVALVALLAASVARQYIASRYAQTATTELTRSPRRAIGALQRASQLDPYSMNALYALSAAYARLDDYADARASLELASTREPDNYVPHALLGDLALRRGAYTTAAADYARALQLNPRDPQLLHDVLVATGASR